MKEHTLTKGSVGKGILLFVLPIIVGSLIQQLYVTIDAVVVGQFTGKLGLAAIDSVHTLFKFPLNFMNGLATGATILISGHCGSGDERQMHCSIRIACTVAVILGVVCSVGGVILTPWMLQIMSVPDEVYGRAFVYTTIYFGGIWSMILYNMTAGILRAYGDSKRPLYFLVASCLTNIALDLLFVVCFHMEVAGAALATIMSQLLSAVLVMITLIRTKESYRFIPKELRVEPVLLKRIIKIGLPAGLQSMMYSISNILIQANINGYGTNTIASWAVYGKIDGIFWMTMDAMGISVTTFAGQNFGAGKIKRLKKGTYVGLLMSTIITAALGLFMFTAGPVLISLFTNDADVMAESMSIIRFLVPFWFCYICVNVYPCTLRGVGDALIPMLIICVGTCILRVLWVFGAGAVHPGLYTTLTSYPLSWSITSLAFLVYYYRFSAMRKLNKLIEE